MSGDLSISKIAGRAIDKLDEFSNNIKYTQQQKNNKKVLIGDYLNGQVPYAGMQTAAQRLGNN